MKAAERPKDDAVQSEVVCGPELAVEYIPAITDTVLAAETSAESGIRDSFGLYHPLIITHVSP